MIDAYAAPLEFKFADADAGTFTGIASAFGVQDSHGDVVLPGAFAASLAEHKASGTMPAMFVCHGAAGGADPYPAGVWSRVEETKDGLQVEGRLLGLDTDRGRYVRSLMMGGALRDLSIGFKVAHGGAIYGRPERKEPRRQLRAVKLFEISLVPQGSNPRARVQEMKSRVGGHDAEDLDEIRERIRNGGTLTEREWERAARDAYSLSRAEATLAAGRGLKALARESEPKADTGAIEALRGIAAAVEGFSLPSFRS
jgi:HK97 family phage prohead protease